MAITRRRNGVEENGSTTLSTCLRVYGHPLLTTPKGNYDCLPIAYGSFSQYRRNDPPGQPMAEVLCACRLSTDIVLSIRAPITPGKQGNTSKETEEESCFFMRNWQGYIQICAMVTLTQRPTRYSIARTKKVLHME